MKRSKKPRRSWRIEFDAPRSWEQLESEVAADRAKTRARRAWATRLVMGLALCLGLSLKYTPPTESAADRMAGLEAFNRVYAAPRIYDRAQEIKYRRTTRGQVNASAAASAPTLALAIEYDWPQSAPRVPTFAAQPTRLLHCATGAVTGSTTVWECAKPDGTSGASCTDPGGATLFPFFDTGLQARWVTGATAVSCTSSVIDAAMNGAHTIVTAISPSSDVPQYNYVLSNATDATGGPFVWRLQSGNNECIDTVTPKASSFQDSWALAGCGWNGTTGYRSYFDRVAADITDATSRPAWTGGQAWYFGTRSARDLELLGGQGFVDVYSGLLTLAQFRGLTDQFQGGLNAGLTTPMSGSNTAGVMGLDFTATTGLVAVVPQGQWADSRGLMTQRAFQNYWGADPQSASGSVQINAPTITSNVAAGPFRFIHNDTPCDLVAGNGTQGIRSLDAGPDFRSISTGQDVAGGWMSTAVYVLPGTSGTTRTAGRLHFNTNALAAELDDGGTTLVCPFSTNQDGGVSRAVCRVKVTTDGGNSTFVNAEMLIGSSAGDTGSLLFCQGQFSEGFAVRAPLLDAVPRGSGNFQMTTEGFPFIYDGGAAGFASGKVEEVFVGPYNPTTQAAGYDIGPFAYDLSNTELTHVLTQVPGANIFGDLLSVFRAPDGGVSDLYTGQAVINYAPDSMAVLGQEWRVVSGDQCHLFAYYNPCSGTVADCHATMLINSGDGGTRTCPGQPEMLNIMRRYNSAEANPSDSFVRAFRVYGP